MKKYTFISVLAVLLVGAVILCFAFGKYTPDTAKVTQPVNTVPANTPNFSLSLLQSLSSENENVLVSPLCASSALTVAALGTDGETRIQLENVLGANGNLDSLTLQLGSILSDSGGAVSLWLCDDGRLTLNDSYLEDVKSLDAYVSALPFDTSAIDAMNGWVSEKTHGRIDSLVDEIPPEAVLYILSTLSFDGEWVVPYSANDVMDGQFVASDGTSYSAEFMRSTENIYLETSLASGIAKPYTDGSVFVALLPNEGVSITDLIASLDSDSFINMLRSSESKNITVFLPKFTAESKLSLSDTIINMGAPNAFSPDSADFSPLGAPPHSTYISNFLQNNYLCVDESGTEGGSASGIEVSLKSAPTASLKFDRPFVYFIVKNDTILFEGVLERI